MLEFLRPWALVMLPLPWLAWRLVPAHGVTSTLRVPHRLALLLDRLASAQSRAKRRRRLRACFATLGWTALVLALAAPLTRGEPLAHASGRDLLLALDLSASMLARDVTLDGRQVERYAAVKALADAFIAGRAGDRVGLIVFGNETHLVAPLTFDVDAVAAFLDEVAVGLSGRKTAVGDAIGLAIKTLQQQPETSRVLILLSDGDSNSGIIVPMAAAALARKHRVRIHTIGFSGEPEASPTRQPDHTGQTDTGGGLRQVAELTGGRHFVARTTAALRKVYTELDRLEPTETEAREQLAERDWVRELLLIALTALAALTWLDLRQAHT